MNPVLARIRSNQKRLDDCPRHSFDVIPIDDLGLGKRLNCNVCGGELDAIKAYYYTKGFEAAGGNANLVIPGFR